MTERRRRPPPARLIDYLVQMPALTLLDRLPIPTIAVGPDGVLIYANPACSRLFGHAERTALVGQSLSALLVGREHSPPHECLEALRAADGAVIDWFDTDGFPIRTVTSNPLLIRASDPVLLVAITDVTDSMWNSSTHHKFTRAPR